MAQIKDAPLHKRVLAFGIGAVKGAFVANTLPYFIASYNRWQKEEPLRGYQTGTLEVTLAEETLKILNEVGRFAGANFGALAGSFAQVAFYATMVQNGNPYVLAVPVLTNAASYLYERHRAGLTTGRSNPPSIDAIVSA